MKYILTLILVVCYILPSIAQTQEQVSLKEFLAGSTTKYYSKGEGKAYGLKINLKYPASWTSKEGERPHIVKKFEQPNGNVLGMLFINKGDAIFTESEIAEVMTTDGLKSIIPDYATYVSSNPNLKIEGLKAGSIEYTATNKRVDLTIYTHNLSYIFVYKQYLIMIQFYVSGTSDESNEQIDARYNEIKPLFPLIFNSIVIENLWE